MNKLTLTLTQSHRIIDVLQSTNGDNDAELIEQLKSELHLSHELVESYFKSWRHNHKQGAIAVTLQAVEVSRKVTAQAAVHAAPQPSAAGGIVQQILALYDAGKSNNEIIALGYNKSTVYRQVNEYRKRLKAAQ